MRPSEREWWVLLGYGIAFHLAHTLAAWWGSEGFFSLWYPPAGLRFALLWVFGPRLTVAVTLVELMVQILAGVLTFGNPEWPTLAISIVRPALAYGLAIAAVRQLCRDPASTLSTPPMPFGFAAVVAPVTAVLAALPWSLLRPEMTGVETVRDIVQSLTTFAVGDLLGVLILAPPIIFMADLSKSSEVRNIKLPTVAQVLEWVGVLGCGGAITITTASLGLSDSLTPLMLAAAWIGLRFGRTAAWFTIVVVALAIFPLTSSSSYGEGRLSTHMSVAAVAIAGYLAASFSTAMMRAQNEIARRDRMLLHAERLKTLRSMSVAIIHEVSQPLSTLLLEARHLKTATQKTGDMDLIDTAELVEKKTAALANMTQKLREFGSRGIAGQTSVDVFQCVNDAMDVLAAEFPRVREVIRIQRSHNEAYVQALPLELTQSILNLLRNSLQAVKPSAEIRLSIISTPELVSISIVNPVARSQSPDGMGVGLIISRTIIEALGGKLDQGSIERGRIETVLTLPKDVS